MAENGGSERASYHGLLGFLTYSPLSPALVVSTALLHISVAIFIAQEQHVVDEEFYGDPNIDLEAEYLGNPLSLHSPPEFALIYPFIPRRG